MKKKLLAILVGVALLLALGTVAEAKVYRLSLSADSGSTTVASGTSNMIVNTTSGNTRIYVGDVISGTTCILQLASAVSAMVCDADEALGNYSGTTWTVRVKESYIDNQGYWDKAQPVTLVDGIALSGNTLYQVGFILNGSGYAYFEALSGITRLETLDYYLITREE